MGNVYSSLSFHLVWSTKNRLHLIKPEYKEKLYGYIGGIIKNEGGMLLKIGGTVDHVHLLIRVSPMNFIPDLVRIVKANSSRVINGKFPKVKFGWQRGYGIFCVSCSMLKVVEDYIDNQEEHHKKIGFKEEFVLLLRKHGIAYDEKFLFE